MAKISQVSSKYIVHTNIDIEGVVDRPDVIGAIFGQTEGLLGADLELRELQRSGRIGRIEVNIETRSGKTTGTIIVPSSLDKAETAIIGAALEIIQRIGPCNAKIRVEKIEDVRVSKRAFVIDRAKELLKSLMDKSMPDSQELADEVAYSVRVMEIVEYGKDRLPAGPQIDESDEIIIVEGRADVLNLLKHGIKNSIAMNGTSVPDTIRELIKQKATTIFVDGDRGGDLIIKELLDIGDIDYVTKAPDGKEVEEITKKEIHKAIRSRITAEQAKLDFTSRRPLPHARPNQQRSAPFKKPQRTFNEQKSNQQPRREEVVINPQEKKTFKNMLEDLVGTRGAYVLDNKLSILGKVPVSELASTIKSLKSGVYAVVFDGDCDKNFLMIAERANIKHVIARDIKTKLFGSKVNVITAQKL